MTQQGAVVAFLSECGGAIFDSAGQASQMIAEATKIPPSSLSPVLTRMERAGQISRDIENQRTYLIVLRGYGAEEESDEEPVESLFVSPPAEAPIALTIVEEELIVEEEPTPEECWALERSQMRQTIGNLRDRCNRLQQALEREQYNRKVGAMQLAEAIERADRAEKNADIMQSALQRGYDPVRALISDDERRSLDHLLREVPNHIKQRRAMVHR